MSRYTPGNGLSRCFLCQEVVETGEPERRHFRREHSRWDMVLWWWDNGHRLPLIIAFAEILAIATGLVVLLRWWLGV
ncbi:hypothetical protein [Micromonospora sp. RV43]|uniref:hypothetical protein n=1 Tax=Micromonospora sp. RV43 TaxID=1661387 RepID=UPI00064C1D02|nr:hypothetical protein [Micromonospora sp. RV43]